MTKYAPPSKKQAMAILGSNKPFNLWEGSIRSGKTFWSMLWLYHKIQTLPPGDGMILGQTAETIYRNFMNEFLFWLDDEGIKYRHIQNSHIDVDFIYNDEPHTRRMYIVGAKDKGAIKRIRGSTLMIAYVDELTMMPQVVFDELVGRLSHKESILLATTNPDGPHHWVLKQYVEHPDKKQDWTRWTFTMDDNLALSDEYKQRIKRQYSGLPARYQRMILGKWVMADGLIYDVFDPKKHVITRKQMESMVKGPPMKWHVAVDYGTKNPTVFGLIGQWPHPNPTRDRKYLYILVKEYYYDGRKAGISKTTSAYLQDFRKFIGQKRISTITIDPSATPLIAEFEKAGLRVTEADNEVLGGIALVANALAEGYFYVLDECTHTIEEFGLYIWDEVAGLKGIDRPVKENDHCMDMIRYFFKTHADPSKRGGVLGASGW